MKAIHAANSRDRIRAESDTTQSNPIPHFPPCETVTLRILKQFFDEKIPNNICYFAFPHPHRPLSMMFSSHNWFPFTSASLPNFFPLIAPLSLSFFFFPFNHVHVHIFLRSSHQSTSTHPRGFTNTNFFFLERMAAFPRSSILIFYLCSF